MRSVITAILGLTLAACQQAEAPSTTEELALQDQAGLNEILDGYVDRGSFPFLYARLETLDGTVLYEHSAANKALVPGDIPINGDTWIRIWSMSKIVTISTVLDLAEDGILSLEDPITKYIPEFADLEVAVMPDGSPLLADRDAAKTASCPLDTVALKRDITIRDLLTHEAGFYYALTGVTCIDDGLNAADLPKAIDSEDLIARLATLPLIQQPGDYHYGTNTTVLGLVAERATGKSLKALVEERITGPLNIDGLQYGKPEGVTLLPRFSGASGALKTAERGELDIFSDNVPDYDPDHALYLGGEGMLGTADGYTDFLRMLLNRGELEGHRVLDEDTIVDLTSPQTQLDNPFGHDGYNIWVNNGKLVDGSQGRGGLWIGGGYEGTHYWIDPELGFVGVVMTQVFAAPSDGWTRDETFREAVYDRLVVGGERYR
ncbi:MAG: serine hydrolase [Pseudomonadota bacterium]